MHDLHLTHHHLGSHGPPAVFLGILTVLPPWALFSGASAGLTVEALEVRPLLTVVARPLRIVAAETGGRLR